MFFSRTARNVCHDQRFGQFHRHTGSKFLLLLLDASSRSARYYAAVCGIWSLFYGSFCRILFVVTRQDLIVNDDTHWMIPSCSCKSRIKALNAKHLKIILNKSFNKTSANEIPPLRQDRATESTPKPMDWLNLYRDYQEIVQTRRFRWKRSAWRRSAWYH